MKSIDKKTKNIIFVVVGLGLLAISYFGLYSNLSKKTEQIEGENKVLAEDVAYLQDLKDHEQEYMDESERMNIEMEEIIAQFPAAIRPENQIMYANGLEARYTMGVEAIDMPGTTAVQVDMATPEPVAAPEPVEGEETAEAPAEAPKSDLSDVVASNIVLNNSSTSYTYSANYRGLKEFLKYINEDPERKSVESVSVSFDNNSGNLTGTVVVNMFSLQGTEKNYVEPNVTGISEGNSALFKGAETYNRVAPSQAGDTATADGIVKDAGDENSEE